MKNITKLFCWTLLLCQSIHMKHDASSTILLKPKLQEAHMGSSHVWPTHRTHPLRSLSLIKIGSTVLNHFPKITFFFFFFLRSILIRNHRILNHDSHLSREQKQRDETKLQVHPTWPLSAPTTCHVIQPFSH